MESCSPELFPLVNALHCNPCFTTNSGQWVADDVAAPGTPLGIVGIAYNGTLLAYAVASHYTDHSGRSASFSFGTRFGNVSLPGGAVAELWAGMRFGHFRALSASASLTWMPSASSDSDAAPGPAGSGALPSPTPAAAGSTAPTIEQRASVGMASPKSFAAPAPSASKPAMAAILNFTAPPNFNPAENMVEMWLTGQWDNSSAANASATPSAPPAGTPAIPIGGVALVRNGKILAYTFPSDEAKAEGGTFFYGAVWQNVGLPSDGGVVEVWAGMQGGVFKGLKVRLA